MSDKIVHSTEVPGNPTIMEHVKDIIEQNGIILKMNSELIAHFSTPSSIGKEY